MTTAQKRKLDDDSVDINAREAKRAKIEPNIGGEKGRRRQISLSDKHLVMRFNSHFGIATGNDTKLSFKGVSYDPTDFTKYVDAMGGTVLTYNADKDSDYDFARRCAHGFTWDQYPAIISYCVGVSDVIETIAFSRRNNLLLVLRSGGHSSIGACTGGPNSIILDVSNLKNLVFNAERTEVVIGAGVTFGQLSTQIEYLNETEGRQLHCVTGGCDSVSISGYTLGGGYGITSREFGMGCDNVLEMEVVLADGSVKTVRKGDELFWGLLGGTGGNFGVVTSFTLKVHQGLRNVTYFSLNYPISQTGRLFQLWQNSYCTNVKPSKIAAYCLWFYFQRPEWEGMCVSIRGLYHGTKDECKKEVQDLLDIKYEEGGVQFPITEFTEGNYRMMNKGIEHDTYSGMGDSYPDGQWKQCRIYNENQPLSDADVQNIVTRIQNMPSFAEKVNLIYCEPYGQKINSLPRDENAYVHRNGLFDLVVDSMYYHSKPESSDEAYKWMVDFFASLPSGDKNIADKNDSESYQNYPDPRPEAGSFYAQAYFAENYPRLQKLKREVDPNNVFRSKQMIFPAER